MAFKLFGIWHKRGARKLKQLTAEQLRRERIRLDQFLQKSQRELAEIESAKAALFHRGREALSSRERESIARQIQRLDMSAKHQAQRTMIVGKHLHVVDGLLCVRENQHLIEQMQVGSAICDLPLDQITQLVEDATVDGDFELEKFVRVAQILDGAANNNSFEVDEDLQRIISLMDEASSPDIAEAQTLSPSYQSESLTHGRSREVV